MRIARSLEIDDAVQALSVTRPVFHSEADSRLAFTWQAQLMDPAMRIRLETRPLPGLHLDIAFAHPDLTETAARGFTSDWHDQLTDLPGHAVTWQTSGSPRVQFVAAEQVEGLRPLAACAQSGL